MGNATVSAQNDDLVDDLVAAIRCARNIARDLAGTIGHRRLTEIETILNAALTRAQGDDPFDADARAVRQLREAALKSAEAPAPTIGFWN